MVVFINSLLFLRLINIALFIAVGTIVLNRIKKDPAWSAVFLNDNDGNNSTKNVSALSWATIDLENPPALSNLELKAMQLNELLSKPQYKCQNLRIVGTFHDNYALCFDEKFLNDEGIFGKSLLITGMTNAPTGLEKELNVSRWEVFLPQGAAVMDVINVDIEISYISEVMEGHYFPMDSILDSILPTKYSVTKLQFYSEVMDSEKQLMKAVGRVLKVILQTQHLLLEIRVNPTSAIDTLPMWTKLLYQLFFKYSYALLKCMSNHVCFRPLRHCIYRATFVKVPLSEASGPPVWGLGSPGEERSRLLTHLTRIDSRFNCSKALEFDDIVPRICLDHEELDLCGVLYVRYSPLTSLNVTNLKGFFNNCNVTIHYPEPIEFATKSKILIQSSGILPRNQPFHIVPGREPPNQWQLQSFEQIVTSFIASAPNKKYLLLDLEGDEMEVIDQIVENCDILKKFRQIGFRMRVFFGEENINYRRLYFYLLKLEHCGFHKVFSSRVNVSTLHVIFKWEPGFVKS